VLTNAAMKLNKKLAIRITFTGSKTENLTYR